ncbi:hypothetical protein AVEN_26116-1 [Araneus ventricosus]|uniref:Secreted protein n=1 Tax=Araneus ventricosus TaxID=182803 RepID=A0A4Y2NX88_ARAVE|nr:hypothetical protein AVEN_26116-1 [Araneus ventricosus]
MVHLLFWKLLASVTTGLFRIKNCHVCADSDLFYRHCGWPSVKSFFCARLVSDVRCNSPFTANIKGLALFLMGIKLAGRKHYITFWSFSRHAQVLRLELNDPINHFR